MTLQDYNEFMKACYWTVGTVGWVAVTIAAMRVR